MKLYYSLLFVLICFQSLFSQPIITSEWFHSIGDTTLTASFNPESQMKPNEGANIVWDISNLPPATGENQLIWVDASELTYSNEFPNAPLGYTASWGGEFFFGIINNRFQLVGRRIQDFRTEYNGNGPKVACDNFSFNDSKIIEYEYLSISEQSGDTTIYEATDELSYAGFGTVITPVGTYENCVMIKLVRTANPSLFNLTEYRFYKDNLSNLIALHAYSPINTEPAIRIRYKIENLTTNIDELNKTKIEFESVNGNHLFIKSSIGVDAKIQIIDITGKVLFKEVKELIAGRNEIMIDQLNGGNIYFLVISDRNSKSFQTINFFKE